MSSSRSADKNVTEPEICGFTGCRRDDDVEVVTNGDGITRATCPRHKKVHLGVTS